MKVEQQSPDPKLFPAALNLLDWWDRRRRTLPWRALPGDQADPYLVLLSEFLLQQTTVKVATPYFTKFISLWPTIDALAAASLDDVLRAFAGLGYYARARRLHACVCKIVGDGAVPTTERALRQLPGVGDYTAAAIAAIAFNQPSSPVDGNIARIMCRYFAILGPFPKDKKAIVAAALSLTPHDRSGDFAQALMDLGSQICTPRKPACP